MKLSQLVLIALATAAFGPSLDARPAPTLVGVAQGAGTDVAAFGWRADERDHVCGVRLPAQVTNPAQIDLDRALAATDEWKQMKRDGIDPESAEGRALKRAAMRKVSVAAESVQRQHGHCSVWKHIAHTDGRQVPDVTAEVLLLL